MSKQQRPKADKPLARVSGTVYLLLKMWWVWHWNYT